MIYTYKSSDDFDFNTDLGSNQEIWLEAICIICMIIYAFVIIATFHTMFIHETCQKKKLKQVNMNLFLFYFLAVVVCVGRYISLISIYLAVKKDSANSSFYYNYGYYTATFSIILIAV